MHRNFDLNKKRWFDITCGYKFSTVLENKSKCDMFTNGKKDDKQKIIRKAYFDPPVNMYLSVY